MDEAVELIITGTKYQNYQSIISIFFSGLNSLFFFLNFFLFKEPMTNNKNSKSLEEICSYNNITHYIDADKSINNYSIQFKFFCNENKFLVKVFFLSY